MKRKVIPGSVLAIVLLAAMFHFYGGHQTPSGQVPLESLTPQNVAEFKHTFNAANGDARVLLLLSPT